MKEGNQRVSSLGAEGVLDKSFNPMLGFLKADVPRSGSSFSPRLGSQKDLLLARNISTSPLVMGEESNM